MKTDIAIITVVYNNYEVLEDFFKSLELQTNKNFHVFIADASDKKEPIQTDQFSITVIPCKNLGYAHGINLGIKEAIRKDMQNFCVINDDVYFHNDFVENMVASFTSFPGSVFGGKIYYAPGYEYHDVYAKEHKGLVLWYAGGIVDWKHALTYHRGVDELDDGQFENVEPTEFVTGCFMCFDKTVVETIGEWDTKYFLYYEDADYCERAKKAGIKLIYNPTLMLWHKNAQSTGGSGSKLHEKFQKNARLRFGLKFAPLRTKLHLMKNYLFSNLASSKS